MKITLDEIVGFVDRPSEGLNREIKRWIDPATPAGIEKIVKACFALRNRNGGYLLVGFDGRTLQPDVADAAPPDVQTSFHVDTIQGIVSKYASESFEIAVGFHDRDGQQYPVIKVDDGVRSPLAVRRSLDNGSGKLLLCEGDVFFRTLNANGTPSSAKALWKDWPEIVEICFENREADIGRFFRRHLTGKEAATLVEALSRIAPAEPPPTLRERADSLLVEGEKKFKAALAQRTLTAQEKEAFQKGMWQIALIVDPEQPGALPDKNFLNVTLGSNPELTGWPIWLDSRGFSDRSAAPYVKDDAWQALIISLDDRVWSKHVDFLTLDPKGEFYLQRILQDDLTDKVMPGKALDPLLVVIRVAEAIAVALSMIKALGWTDEARLGIAFQWTKLYGRELSSWANPLVMIIEGHASHTSYASTFVEIPASTPVSAIAPYVEEAARGLFVLFDGYIFTSQVIEHWTQRLIERRL